MFDKLGKNSILSYPDRGKWGDKRWRGNMSGHVYQELFHFFQPKTFVDPMRGSGTSIEVAREMGIDAVGLDLQDGFDATRHSILEHVGREADMCVSHPPYAWIIKYSGHVWGEQAQPGDLSHIKDYDEFIDALQAVMLNQRTATRRNGVYGTIVGDVRHRGAYHSIQADLIQRLPKNELKSVLIKAQWNTKTEDNTYAMRYPWVTHEYILLWEKTSSTPYAVLARVTKQNDRHVKGTWKAILRSILQQLGGSSDLPTLYDAVAAGAREKLARNSNWQAKIRQTLQRYEQDFHPLGNGVWSLNPSA